MKTILLCLLLFYTLKSDATNYYFSSTSGNDLYSTTQAQNPLTPWRTIIKLNTIFVSLNPGDSILFIRGEIFYGSILISKSGNADNPIVIGAYGSGPNPIVTGLTTITDWQSLGNGLYEKTLNSAPANSLNMVLFDSTIQPIGRYPKEGLGNNSYFTITNIVTTNIRWPNSEGTIKSTGISSLPNLIGGEVVYKPFQWIINRATVSSQAKDSICFNSIVPQSGGASLVYPRGVTIAPQVGHGFFFQNHINTLTTLGDWCYNQSLKKIIMYFGTVDPTSHKVEVATLDSLCQIKNESYISIQNISFKGANEYAINIDSVKHCVLNNLNISYIGINGINARTSNKATDHGIIDGCNLDNILNNGIDLSSSPYWTITNNHIQNIAMIAGMGLSDNGQYIGLYNVGSNSLVEHNLIENIGYTGLYFTGSNVTIRYNNIHHYCMTKADGGGIYTYGATGTNRLLQNNIIHDGIGNYFGLGYSDPTNLFNSAVHGIYMDGGATDVTITDNSSFRNSNSGLLINDKNANIVATNNTLYDNEYSQILISTIANNIVSKHNIVFANKSSELIMCLQPGASLPALISDSNYMCRPIWEPNGISSPGYTTSPLSEDNYHDGGIVKLENFFYSLENWQKNSKEDGSTKKTPVTNINRDDVLFEYNTTNNDKTIILNGTYIDVKGSYYNSVILSPYSSIILIKTNKSLSSLDLKFLNFNASKNISDIDLKWMTTDEVNSSYFEVEKSDDGINFFRIDSIPAINIFKDKNSYLYKDIHPLNGNNFYRIKQVSSNGQYLFSQIAQISFEKQLNIQLSPNPVKNLLKISVYNDLNPNLKYVLIQSLSGKIMKRIPISSSVDVLTIDMSNFPNSMYIVSIFYNNLSISRNIVKVGE